MRRSPLYCQPRWRAGFTLPEVAIVIAIVGLASAMALPTMGTFSANQRLQDSIHAIDHVFSLARGEAIRTGNIHLVFFGSDTLGNPLIGPEGLAVGVLVVNDGLPGSADQNCLVDANEAVTGFSLPAQGDVAPGVSNAVAKVDSDGGTGAMATGATFSDAGGAPASWVMFRPEGTTRAFSSDCSQGATGSGAGAVYLTNGGRDAAVVLTALGSSRVHGERQRLARRLVCPGKTGRERRASRHLRPRGPGATRERSCSRTGNGPWEAMKRTGEDSSSFGVSRPGTPTSERSCPSAVGRTQDGFPMRP